MDLSFVNTQIAALGRDEVYYIVDETLGLDLQPQFAIHASEENKSLDMVTRIWDWLFSLHATRKALIVCIGGGVITDLGGFAASTYRRGVDYVNVPTTLLAMVDAATGGKTGVNYNGLKNAIGVIREPLATLIMPEWLNTLPSEQLISGFGEVIKTALLDNLLYQKVQSLEFRVESLEAVINDILVVKRRIVKADPTEQGIRKALNLGHTVGHALEELSIRQTQTTPLQRGLGGVLHGYAVMYGLVAELYLSVIKLGLDRKVLQQISHLMIEHFSRPQCGCADYTDLIALMRDDKKNETPRELNFTLLRAIGEPVINCAATEDEVKEALDYLFTL